MLKVVVSFFSSDNDENELVEVDFRKVDFGNPLSLLLPPVFLVLVSSKLCVACSLHATYFSWILSEGLVQAYSVVAYYGLLIDAVCA